MSFHLPCYIRGDLRKKEKAINQSTCLHAKTKYQSLISVYPRAQIEAILTENTSMLRLCSWCISPGCQNRFGAGGKIVERRVKKKKKEAIWQTLSRIHSQSQQFCFICAKSNTVTHTLACLDTFSHFISSVLVILGCTTFVTCQQIFWHCSERCKQLKRSVVVGTFPVVSAQRKVTKLYKEGLFSTTVQRI